jgi:hypothetical protein
MTASLQHSCRVSRRRQDAWNVILCGDDVVSNAAGSGAFAGGVFMTCNDFTGTCSGQDSIIAGNTGSSWTQVTQRTVTNLGTAFGVNAKSASVLNSTLPDGSASTLETPGTVCAAGVASPGG